MFCIIPGVLQVLVLISIVKNCVICIFQNNYDEQIENQQFITEV
jgi:hypothetical protein